MKKIAAVLITSFTSFTLFAQSSLAAAPQAATPAATPGAIVAAAPAPAPSACYITVSPQTLDEDKACAAYKLDDCYKKPQTCKWMGRLGCRGLIASFCVAMTPRECESGLELVTAIPKKPSKGSLKFQCHEKNPIKLKKL